MKGFILAAGFGQRMLPITQSVPKPLLPVAGAPLIAYSIALLAKHGITDIIINVHHLAASVMAALGDGSRFGVRITYSQEAEILGTGGGLKRMHEALADTFVVVNSDILIDLDLTKVLNEHRARGALATMVLREPDAAQASVGRIGIDRAGRMASVLGQDPGPASDPRTAHRALMFTGVQVLEPLFLDYIPHNLHSDIVRYAYMRALGNRAPLYGTVTTGYWADAGTPETYLAANQTLLANPAKLPHIDPLAAYTLRPRRDVAQVVCMGDGVHLGEGATLTPPVLLGAGARTGDASVVGPHVVVGDNVHIGRDARVTNSVLLAGARVPPGARLDAMLVGAHGSLSLAAPNADAAAIKSAAEPRTT